MIFGFILITLGFILFIVIIVKSMIDTWDYHLKHERRK